MEQFQIKIISWVFPASQIDESEYVSTVILHNTFFWRLKHIFPSSQTSRQQLNVNEN